MPNDDQISLQACLSALEELQNGPEDAVFSTTYKDHLNLLQSLNTVLSNKVEVSPADADRVLKICLRYTTDVRCVLYVFSIISELIDIDKDDPLVDFLPFALAILEFLNTKCHKDNTSKLRILSFQVLMKHPKSTLIKLIRDHSPNIIQTFQLIVGLNKAEDLPSVMESFKLLSMLEWLPPYEKRLFMEAGLTLWLAGVIPAMMQIVVSAEDVNKIESCLTSIELLAKELVLLNYYQNPHWKSLLECIANPKMFPASIMGLLESGKDNWHRIWIVLIKILKSQLTRNCSPFMSPINSMLPIVESAFKKESAQRVRAFACWNELIESFYHETGNCAEKRIKLLIIPLKLYNTKTEETAVAKFHTWWLFIHKFIPKIQKFTNEILISFLHFMFGPGTRQQAVKFQACQVSYCLRKKCIDAFAEIMHVNCSKCAITNLNRLDSNITTTVLLTDHWKDFVYALKSCIWAVAQSYTEDTKSKIQCIWISFVRRLATMTEDTLRQNMFDDLIDILSELTLEDDKRGNEYLMEILVDDITLPLWRDKKLKTLTESRRQSHRPMHRIVKLIMDDQFNNYFKRFNSEELARLLQPLISSLLEESISTPEYIIWLLDELLVTNSTLIMWTALAQASQESKLSLEAFNKILLWPFKTVHVSFEVKEAAEAWYTLYNIIHENLEQTDFDHKISKVLTRPVEDSKASNYFVLFALIGVLKHKPDEEKMAKLEALTYEMNDYDDFEQLLIPLVNTIELVINNSTDENLAQIAINCVENILKVIKSETEAIGSKSLIHNRENTFSNLRAGSDTITSTLKTYLETCPYQSIKKQVRTLLSLHDKNESPEKVSESPKMGSKSPKKGSKSPWKTPFFGFDIPPKEFASPKTQELKKRKNKEARIETTVVENGEEYVVVKSNWKFNPKILTENQKEKLQRKRDIPALYQDLSQSQDEFKLTSWKTDSQDTSLSSSKSATSNDVSDTLKEITNPDIVPKIMENIYCIGLNSKPKTGANVSPIAKVKTPKADKLSTPGDSKSPRLALKERVYRNVRILSKNSSPSPQDKVTEKQEEGNVLQNVSRSPLSKPELVCIESPAKKAESNEKKLNSSNDYVITTNKQKNGSPVTSPPIDRMKQIVVISTPRIDEMMQLVYTPVSQAQNEINLNSEECEVVKSNCKFVPNTLTKNQKENLQRKRDVPALYQDLSQSQEEFKLTSWKTDSQDISLSSSKSATSKDVSDSLKKITTSDIGPKVMENLYDIEKHSQPKTDANVSPIAKVMTPKADKLSTPGDTKSPRVALKDKVYRNVSNLIRNLSPSPQDKVTDKQGDGNILQIVSKSPVAIPELVCIESPAKKAEPNEKTLKPSNDDVITTNKHESGSPLTSSPNDRMRQVIVYTPRIDEIMNLACTPVSKAQKDINLQLSAPQTPVDRPARLKRTPKKFDNSLVLAVKKKRCSKYDQDLPYICHTETVIAQIHKPNNRMDVTDAISPQKVAPKEAETNENVKKSPTATDNPIIVENVTSCTAADDKSPKDIEKDSLISPKTSSHKTTAKSPEKPFTGEILSHLNKASEGVHNDTGEIPSHLNKVSESVHNDAAQNETYDVKDKQNVKTYSSNPKKLDKTPVKKTGAQLIVITNHNKIKWRNEYEVQKEISSNDENVTVNTPVTADKDLNQPKLSAKKSVLLNDTDMNTEKAEAVPTPINNTKKDSYTSLVPLSKPQEPQTTPEKLGARHEVITDNMDTPIKSPRKFRKCKVQKEISLHDENAAVNIPVTTDKDLNQPKLSAKKKVLQNDTDKNVEKVEVVPVSINKTKKVSDTSLLKSTKKSYSLKYSNENKKLSNTLVKTKKACPAKLTQKKVYDVETENNKDENLSINPKTQKKIKTRIEKILAIDMVEGHPFLKTQPAKRLTRKTLMEVENGSKRKSLIDNLNKSKLELTPKTSKKNKKCSPSVKSTVEDSQDKAQNVMDEPPCSEDIIESSQDSTMTTICVKAKKRTPKLLPVVALEKITLPITLTRDLIRDCKIIDKPDEEKHESTDIELPQNKSVESYENVIDLTENMDTEPIGDSKNTTDLTENMDTEPLAGNDTVEVIIHSETLPTPVTVNSESELVIGPETQELAEADTQPNDPKQFEKWEINKPLLTSPNSNPPESLTIDDTNIENEITQRLPEAALGLANMDDTTEVSSPCKDDDQRKQDFLNNTIEISPIKVQSPDRQKKSPSPETSRDFVVIQLSSPVHSNGEPFDKQCSPEFFTEDKVSPEKQNASPPRVEVTVTNSSPSASLSLKKNRPCSGRAAQMFGLLSMTSDNEVKQLPAKQGLRFYYFKNSKNDCTVEQNPSTEENYLELQRSLPTVTSSPSGPILKRKHVEIIDESTASPAKRKRVSFHDPPVSTTVSVQKYIEPISLMRSPQTSAKKRQTRSGLKSPKKLDNAFLASALSKTVESFTEATTPSDETENISLDVTPAVEIVKTSELNDTDPICPDLIDCTDPIDVIAIELSSAAMRDLFVKELEGKVDTVGDLAKMTELEVNRICIKAPKIAVAKKVLTDYITNRPALTVETVMEEAFSEPMTESLLHVTKADVEMQTDEIEAISKSTQVTVEQVASAQTQTEVLVSANTSVQTVESGCKTAEEIIDSCISCMSEREDLFEKFKEKLSDDQVQSIAGSLSAKNLFRLIMKNTDESSTTVMQRVLKHQCKAIPKSSKPSAELKFFKEMFLERYETAALGSFCTEILQTIFHKPA